MKEYPQKIKQILLIVAVTCMAICCLYYNILLDVSIIMVLLLDSYAIGCILKIQGSLFEKVIIRTAVGLGIIGIILYFILLIGIGNKSVYMALLVLSFTFSLPFISRKHQEIVETVCMIKEKISNHAFLVSILLLLLIGYLIYGSSPISHYDILTKHLPITIYAAENGEWYTNVTESIVYGEPMVLQYTYSVLFYSMGAYKALTLFNVLLFFTVYVVLCYFIRKIYPQSSMVILAVILLTTPFFFHYSTMFYLEILPLYFLFSAFVAMGKLEADKIWNNIEMISFLCGCSVFAKLTSVFTIVVMAMVLIFYCVKYVIKNKNIKQAIGKVIRCVTLGLVPSITSLIYIWYKTGNPLFPSYNGIFKSPYFAAMNFSDPFTNKLSLSFDSLINIVFHTEKNIELYAGGFGVFLLFIFVLPLGAVLLILKKELRQNFEYIVWATVTIVAYIFNTFTTYNLRYYFAVWVLLACVITIGISICLSSLPLEILRNAASIILCAVILGPNLYYIKEHGNVSLKIIKDEQIVHNDFCEVFDNIPQGKKVLSITNSNQFKGQYQGYFASTTWHNGTLDKVNEGKYSWEDYLSSFDYILIDKTADMIWYMEEEVREKLPDFLGQKYFENSVNVLYGVIPQKDIVLETEFEIPQESSVTEPVMEVMPNEKTEYYIKHQIINETDHPITMRYQINWMSDEGELIDVYISTYDAQPGANEYCSEKIVGNKEADYGIVYVVTTDEQKVKIQGYTVEGIENVVEKEANQFESRDLLR